MLKRTRKAGLLFCAIWSVYYGPATIADEDVRAISTDNTAEVKPIGETAIASAAAQQPVIDIPASDSNSAGSAKVRMNDAGSFSIQINNDISLVEVLRMIGNQAQLSIIPSKEVRGTVPAMDLYNVTVYEALDAILHSNGMGWKQKGNLIYVFSQKELDAQKKAAQIATTEIFHLYYTPAANAVSMIKPVLSPDAQVSSTTAAVTGISSSDSEAGGDTHAGDDMIVVTDYPANLEKVAKVLKEIDHRPQQILIEATIFQANLNENNALGIDFSLMGGVNFDTLLGNSTGVSTALSGNILQSSSSSTGGTSNSSGAASIVKQGYSGFTTGNYDTQTPAGGLQIGVVRNNLGVFLSALEQVTDATVLANPKVLALDKQRGEVIVGNQYGYLTTTTTSTTSTQTVQFLETGTRLLFRPYVGDDGYIRMEIHPEDSNGGLNSANLPFKVTTEVTSNVLVKDGNTIVIGGLFREASQTNRSQVPFLGSLPLAGALFRSKSDSTTRQEIIILLTPHIIKDDNAYGKAGEEELKEAEKMRVGVRKGMMWFGRERLAESAYEAAVAEMNKPAPDLNKAIWHLDCATNLNPKFIEAIDLKEKLTGEHVTEYDKGRVRSFVRRQILAESLMPTTAPSPASLPDYDPELNGPKKVPTIGASDPSVALPAVVENSRQPVHAPEPMDSDSLTEGIAATTAGHRKGNPATQPALDANATRTLTGGTIESDDDTNMTGQ